MRTEIVRQNVVDGRGYYGLSANPDLGEKRLQKD